MNKKTLTLVSQLGEGKSHDFVTNFDEVAQAAIGRKVGDMMIALSYVNLQHSWFNIPKEFRNHTFKFSTDSGSTFSAGTFPDGYYSFVDIKKFVNKTIDQANGKENKAFSLAPDRKTLTVTIGIEKGFALDFSGSKFSELIGFEKKKFGEGTFVSTEVVNGTRSVDQVFVNCDAVDFSFVGGKKSKALFIFGVSGFMPSHPIDVRPQRLRWVRMKKTNNFKNIRIFLTDSQGRSINLHDQPSIFDLIIAPIK